jgi:hypothetical protein
MSSSCRLRATSAVILAAFSFLMAGTSTRQPKGRSPSDQAPNVPAYDARLAVARVGIKKNLSSLLLFAQPDGLLTRLGAAFRYVWPSREEYDWDSWNTPIDWSRVSDENMREQAQRAPDVVVSDWGCADAARDLLWGLREPVRRLGQRFADVPLAMLGPGADSPSLAKGYPILVYSSHAFAYRTDKDSEHRELQEYVEKGGMVLAFTQPFGDNFKMLPVPAGERLVAAGYRQDVSSHQKSVFPAAEHPALSSLTREVAAADVDGFFIEVPKSSIVLLRRLNTGMPCFILYPVGNGWVAATTLFLWPRMPFSAEMRALVCDLIAWAKDTATPIPVVTLSKGEKPKPVGLQLKIRNVSSTPATLLEVLVMTPDRSERTESVRLPVKLGPGEEATVPVTLDPSTCIRPDSPRGMYHADYRLLAPGWAGEREVQPAAETESGRFVIRSRYGPSENKRDTLLAASSNNDEPGNTEGLVHIVAEDRSGTARHLHLWGNLSQEPGTLLADLQLSANERRELDIPRDLSRPGTYHFILTDPQRGRAADAFEKRVTNNDPWNVTAVAITFTCKTKPE